MKFIDSQLLVSLLDGHFKGAVLDSGGSDDAVQPWITIKSDVIDKVCQFLHEHESCYFDYLSCVTGIDNGPDLKSMEVIYHLYSLPYEHMLVLKCILSRNTEEEALPEIPSVSSIWKTADWHEREIYDLLGIRFTGHPDLRRILLPADWVGYPLRKDYLTQEQYHDIKVKY